MLTILNFAPAATQFNTELFTNTDYLILNEVETEQLSHLSCSSIDEAKTASLELLDKYDVNNGLIVTLGANGVLYTDKKTKNSIHKSCSPVKVVDTSVKIIHFKILVKFSKNLAK